MSRKEELSRLGSRPAPDESEARVVREAFATWTDRGQVPPLVADALREAPGVAPDAPALLDRLIDALHRAVVREVNEIRKAPVTICELCVGPDLVGVAVLSEPRRVWLVDFSASISFGAPGTPATWTLHGETGRCELEGPLGAEELRALAEVLHPPWPRSLAGHFARVAERWLAPGDEPPWRDPFDDPAEKFRRALAWLDKAAALAPDDAALAERRREVRERAGA